MRNDGAGWRSQFTQSDKRPAIGIPFHFELTAA
jgi:hypothetical protein